MEFYINKLKKNTNKEKFEGNFKKGKIYELIGEGIGKFKEVIDDGEGFYKAVFESVNSEELTKFKYKNFVFANVDLINNFLYENEIEINRIYTNIGYQEENEELESLVFYNEKIINRKGKEELNFFDNLKNKRPFILARVIKKKQNNFSSIFYFENDSYHSLLNNIYKYFKEWEK